MWGGSDERGSLLALVPLLEEDTHQWGEGRGRGWGGAGKGHWEGRHMCRSGKMEWMRIN